MKTKLFSLCLAMALCGCATINVESITNSGWQDLSSGSGLEGWAPKGGKASFKKVDGEIIGTSVPNTPNTFLCTTQEYSDFILEFEFFGHPELNSGVMVRGQSKPSYKDGRVHGYQCELEDEAQDRDWSTGIYDEARRGWLFPSKSDPDWMKSFSEAGHTAYKNGEWNKVRVEAIGGNIKTFLNGIPRADLNDDMDAKGFIGLQVHGVGKKKTPMSVKWRNIRIKEVG